MAAPDFYFAINATFRFIYDRWGEDGLVRYWQALGQDYFAPLSRRFREGGLDAVAAYWRDFFAEEPGGEVSVRREADQVVITVQTCPAIRHLRAHEREIVPLYCRHCRCVNETVAENAGLSFHLEGGEGTCRQVFGVSGRSLSSRSS